MSTYESMELLGMQADTLNNLLGAMQLPIPPETHLAVLKTELFKVMEKLREIYVLETGDNPWL
jgi:hypothetical protein